MQTATHAVPVSKTRIWTGRILGAVPVLLMAFSAIMKLVKPPGFAESFIAHFG
jgi:hypothetical protein